MKKNDCITTEIVDIGIAGEGIGKVDGYTLFIKDAVVGDVVEAKIMKANKGYGYAKLTKLITPSPYRVDEKCSVARQCGGCQLQALSYEKQLDFKSNKVRNNLIRLGGFDPTFVDTIFQPILGMDDPWAYRNKAQFPFGLDKDNSAITGFYAGRTHSIIPNTTCDIGNPINERILEIILDFVKSEKIGIYNEKIQKGLLRHVLIRTSHATDDIMVCLIINGVKIPKIEKLIHILKTLPGMASISISVNKKNTNVIMGDHYEVVWGMPYIADAIEGVSYHISPLSFYQVNPVQTAVLYKKALEYANLNSQEVVWDLYCGIGTISLFLAQKAKQVYGVEIVPQAIEDAKKNAELNNMDNIEFFVGKAEDILPEQYKKTKCKPEVIVVDPPRKGCDETLLQTMLEMSPERIVYVSCDPATLARDLKILCESKYNLAEVTPVDMFPMTVHIESVAYLTLRSNGESGVLS